MTHPDAERWDARYRKELSGWQNQKPASLLLEHAHLVPQSGLALDTASGLSANSLFLAERGLRVIALDISRVALAALRQRAQDLPVSAAVVDLSRLWLPADYFDVIVNFRFLERSIFPRYIQALKPGGILVFETFLRTSESQEHPEYYLQPGELRQAFQELELLHYQEGQPWGETCSPRRTARLVARK